MIPSKKADRLSNNTFHSLLFKPQKDIKRQKLQENLLNNYILNSKSKRVTPISSNDNSLSNSFIIKSNKKEKKNIKFISNNKNDLSFNKNNSAHIKGNDNHKITAKNKEKKNIQNNYKGSNILIYKNIIPKFKKINQNNSRSLSGKSNQNSSYNISGIFNINSIDHLFYRPSSLDKTSNLNSKIRSSNINKVINIKSNNYMNINNKTKLNNSFLNINRKKAIINEKINDNSYIKKNNSTMIVKKEREKDKKNNIPNYNEIKYKTKKIYKNIFKPKNIFSKFKSKKNNNINNEELLLNQKLLINKIISNKPKIDESTIMLNNSKNEDEKYENSINSKINKKELILSNNNINNNESQNNNNLLKNAQNNVFTQFNSHNLLSSTTLITGTDNYNNNQSQNIIENNNNINIINNFFKGKKIRCIHDISKTGLSGEEKKVNQDRYFIFHNFVSGYENIFMGVLDGHGYYGHEVSEYIKENLPMDLNRVLKTKKLNILKDDLSDIIKQTFEMENNSLLRNKQIDSNLSGSTCVSVIYTPEKLIIANLGDSRCVLGKKIENDKWKAVNLTTDHKPSVPEEAERIKSYGGRIRPMKDEDGNFIGPLRVYMKERDIPGLAMTRSFGDYYASTAGTISIPEISEYYFVPEDKFLILASDGLFEFIESDEVVNIVSDYYEKNDIVGCSEFLYKESYRKWIYEEEDTVDDITIILVFFEE